VDVCLTFLAIQSSLHFLYEKANERLTTFFSGLNSLIVQDDVGQQGGGEGS
jgi:hypothetical protein